MKLDDFDISESIFIDANIFIYVSQNDPTYGRACIDFLERVEYMEIKAITTPVVLNEVSYKLLIAKAGELLDTDRFWKIHEELKDKKFTRTCYGIVEEFRDYVGTLCGLRVEDARIDDFNKSVDLGYEFGLVTTDSYHAAAMDRLGLKHIASNDSDFERVDFIEVWAP